MFSKCLLLSAICTISAAYVCAPNSVCDNEVVKCGGGWSCRNPSGAPLGGCCIPDGILAETEEYVPPQFVQDNCGAAFACDDGIAKCTEDSKCVNPSGAALSGCCIPKEMDVNKFLGEGIPSTEKKISPWEYMRGKIADYVIDNCGPAFACDNESYGCGAEMKCINPSGESLSGCCIPSNMDETDIPSGRALISAEKVTEKQTSQWEHMRGQIADYIIDNCGPAFACDNENYGCGAESKCINPSGAQLSGCCIPENMDETDIKSGRAIASAERDTEKKTSQWEHLRGEIADYVIDNCGPAFACDNTNYGCGAKSKCINPSGEQLSGCCIPANMDETDIKSGRAVTSAEKETEKKNSQWEHLRGEVADYVIDNCGPAFACDNESYGCGAESKCINPSGEQLSGCCIPKNMDETDIKSGRAIDSAEKKTSQWEHLRGEIADYVIDNCGPAFACDNENHGCGAESKCINPSGEQLSGCCIPENMDETDIKSGRAITSTEKDTEKKTSEWEHLRGEIPDYVIDNCGPAFACDNDKYGCGAESKCINPSGEQLIGCCIPENMDETDIKSGRAITSAEKDTEKTSQWEHLRGEVADYVIDNCGPAFACDNENYGCGAESKCINPSGEQLSGCCIPENMDETDIKSGRTISPTEQDTDKKTSEWEHLRGEIADYVIDNCGPAFACDSENYGCGAESKCINPSGEQLSGCCIPENMDETDIKSGRAIDSAEKKTSQWEHLRGQIADYVIDNCGPAFACDNESYGCDAESKCINPSGEQLSGCCMPTIIAETYIKSEHASTPAEENEKQYGTLNGIDLETIVAPYVREYCGPAYACDEIGAFCEDGSTCINPTEGPLAGCCVPKGMTREELESPKPELCNKKAEEFGTLNGIDLRSIVAPYVLENCGPSYACDNVGAFCDSDSACINPSAGPLAGCCVPMGMTQEELETGILVKREKVEEKATVVEVERFCDQDECIPTVFTANLTKQLREEL